MYSKLRGQEYDGTFQGLDVYCEQCAFAYLSSINHDVDYDSSECYTFYADIEGERKWNAKCVIYFYGGGDDDDGGGECFSVNGIVKRVKNEGKRKEYENVKIKYLQMGDVVMSMNENGDIEDTEVSAIFYHYMKKGKGGSLLNIKYIIDEDEIYYEGIFKATERHLMNYRKQSNNDNGFSNFVRYEDLKLVKDIEIGDRLLAYYEGKLYWGVVNEINSNNDDDVALVMTENGNLFVDGAIASMYVRWNEKSLKGIEDVISWIVGKMFLICGRIIRKIPYGKGMFNSLTFVGNYVWEYIFYNYISKIWVKF